MIVCDPIRAVAVDVYGADLTHDRCEQLVDGCRSELRPKGTRRLLGHWGSRGVVEGVRPGAGSKL